MTEEAGAGLPVRVTVIHDDSLMRELLEDVLTGLGFNVQHFASATADLHALLASRPILMIVELRLDPHREELSGLQTIHAARSSDELRDVPIIVCSADPTALDVAWADFMDRGDIHRLSIPFDLDTLRQVITGALGATRLAEAESAAGTINADEHGMQSNEGA